MAQAGLDSRAKSAGERRDYDEIERRQSRAARACDAAVALASWGNGKPSGGG